MNFRKRLVALCLVTAAALSLILSASVKCTAHVENEQISLLCESYDDYAKKYC